jgi:pimeloyl-ACP methyl ester carboxylesterase
MSILPQEAFEVFYFGRSDRLLYGALDFAQTFGQREHGIVICYPFGQEYVRAHRACRQLALRLARAGFPVLRFDYGGSGDSAGEFEDADFAGWRDDIGRAIDALQERAGVDSICLVGLRLGASLALEVAEERPDVSALILWEPIVDGSNYLAELAEEHRDLMWRFFDDPDRVAARITGQYLGFAVSDTLRGDLERLDLQPHLSVQAVEALIVERQASPEVARLHALLRDAGIDVAYREIPSFATWREDVDKGLVPDPVLRGIVSWAEEVLP